jgi:hypothetical protein
LIAVLFATFLGAFFEVVLFGASPAHSVKPVVIFGLIFVPVFLVVMIFGHSYIAAMALFRGNPSLQGPTQCPQTVGGSSLHATKSQAEK